jgi:hypothetical protein
MVALALLAAAPVFAYGRMSGNIRPERISGRTVRWRGSCNKRFETVYTALARATGVP